MARPNELLRMPEGPQRLAELLADGATHEQIAETLGVAHRQITEYRKLPEVQNILRGILISRANRILSHTDSKIEKLLIAKGDKMSVDQLLKIRQAFAIDGANNSPDGEAAEALTKLFEAAHSDPELARKLRDVLPAAPAELPEADWEADADDEDEDE